MKKEKLSLEVYQPHDQFEVVAIKALDNLRASTKVYFITIIALILCIVAINIFWCVQMMYYDWEVITVDTDGTGDATYIEVSGEDNNIKQGDYYGENNQSENH